MFNLIVFHKLSARTDYIRKIVEKAIEQFPCRTLFISEDPQPQQEYLKTAVSVISPHLQSTIACDAIDIGVTPSYREQVPFLILPHLVPDLPVYLLWAEDPCENHDLFAPLLKLSDRVIFDSESANSLHLFAQTVLSVNQQIDVADLNWARIQGWRSLLASLFQPKDRWNHLQHLNSLQITYNDRKSEPFCHNKVQSLYLLSWLSFCLHWKFQKASKNLLFQFQASQPLQAQITSALWEKLGSGTIISLEMDCASDQRFHCMRIPEQYHQVGIQISNAQKCELPHRYILGRTATGQSLAQEIVERGTSSHYIHTLHTLIRLYQGLA